MRIRSRLAVFILGGFITITGCSNLTMIKDTRVRTWQLDDDSKVVFRQEMMRNAGVDDKAHNYDRDELRIERKGESSPEATMVIEGEASFKKPSNFDVYKSIEVRSDEARRAVWVVDKRENRVLWRIILRPSKDSSTGTEVNPPEMTPTSGVALKEITPAAPKT